VNFATLWAGQTVSLTGSQITLVGLPLTAVLVLDADAAQVGLVSAALWLPFLLFALFVGALADRVRRLPLLVAADAGRAVVMGAIVALALAGLLRMPTLVALVFVFGTLTVIFEVSYYSLIPSVVPRDHLITANSRLQASASLAEVAGPSAGGLLVAALTAPVALVADAASFVVSAVSLAFIRVSEHPPSRADVPGGVLARIREGVGFIHRDRHLRALLVSSTLSNLFDEWLTVLFTVYAITVLGLGPAGLGLVLSVGAVGALAGSLVTGRLNRRLGVGPAYIWTFAAGSVGLLTLPLSVPGSPATLPMLAVAYALNGFGLAVTNVATISIRQAVTPDRLLGRMNASYRFVSYGAIPVGALAGGLSGQFLGLRACLLVGALGLVAAAVTAGFSPLRSLRSLGAVTASAATECTRACPRSAPRPA
jgi:MFS family permease